MRAVRERSRQEPIVGSETLAPPRADAFNRFAVKRSFDDILLQIARSRQLIAESRKLLSSLDRLDEQDQVEGTA